MEKDKFEIRSEEVQELLGNMPKWIIRWGTIVVFIVVALLFLLSRSLSYPDVIDSEIILSTNVPPAEMKALVDGVTEKILVEDQQAVNKGQILAVINSAADYRDIIWLSEVLTDSFSMSSALDQSFRQKNLKLGSVQQVYAEYVNSLEEYQGFIDVDYSQKKTVATKYEIEKYNKYISDLEEQREVLEKEFSLVDRRFERDSILTAKGVLSNKDLEVINEERLSSLYNLKEEQSNLSSAQIEVAQLEQVILDLELQLKQQNQKIYSNLKAKFEELNGDIDQWMKDYIIIAPFSGHVSMSRIWSENQYVNQGEVVLTIIPNVYDRIVGRVSLKPAGAGKIKMKNRVIIRFDNYPYLEYGVVTGKIESMSLAPEGGVYYASVVLDSVSLVTNYNIPLIFSQNMQGTAEIITESRSLLQRIYAPMKSAIEIQQMYNDSVP